MQLSTTPTLEGFTISEYCGVVTGEAILGANIFRDFLPAYVTSSAAVPAPMKKSCARRVNWHSRNCRNRRRNWAPMRW